MGLRVVMVDTTKTEKSYHFNNISVVGHTSNISKFLSSHANISRAENNNALQGLLPTIYICHPRSVGVNIATTPKTRRCLRQSDSSEYEACPFNDFAKVTHAIAKQACQN